MRIQNEKSAQGLLDDSYLNSWPQRQVTFLLLAGKILALLKPRLITNPFFAAKAVDVFGDIGCVLAYELVKWLSGMACTA